MQIPTCFYQKAFWIVIPILVAVISTAYAAADSKIATLDDRVRFNEVTIAQNNVPDLKVTIDDIDNKIDSILQSQSRIEGKLEILLP